MCAPPGENLKPNVSKYPENEGKPSEKALDVIRGVLRLVMSFRNSIEGEFAPLEYRLLRQGQQSFIQSATVSYAAAC